MIPFLDLKAINLEYADALREAFERVLQSGWFVLGQEVSEFEREWADFCGAQYAVGVGNGLDALALALRAMDVGQGDEVIVPSNTYIASWLAVTQVGANPVPVEPDLSSCNIDPTKIESAITPISKVIMPVHLYGQSADLAPIIDLARERGLRVLEDAAQAHGARYRGKRIGAHGDVVSWSFYPGKNLGALGDGGAITTNDALVAERVRVLRNYGSKVKYHNEVIGCNSRLDELQAALLRVKIPKLDRDNAHRARIAARYLDGLRDLDLTLPPLTSECGSSWHLFVVRTKHRDAIVRKLSEFGIGTMIHYPIPPHLQSAYGDLGFREGSFPISEAIHRQALSLPIGPTLSMTDVDSVIDALRSALSEL